MGHARMTPAERQVLADAAASYHSTGRLRTSSEVHGRFHARRGKLLSLLSSLEDKGLIARTARNWDTGRITELGEKALLATESDAKHPRKMNHFPQGVGDDGGTRYKRSLVSATDGSVISSGANNPKLGHIVTKGRHRGLVMRAITLEEGRTCPSECQLRDRCYGGGMPRAKRVRWEGPKTSTAIAQAIRASDASLFRFHTLGDFPTEEYFYQMFGAIMQTKRSAAFGFTHHSESSALGRTIAPASREYWSRFAIRQSYLHGTRAPILERSAVIVEHAVQAREHNAVLCPEQQGKVKDCASCGYCWHSQRPVAFVLHAELHKAG